MTSRARHAANLFNLSVKDGSTGQAEVFRNVSVQAGHVRQVDKVLRKESQLVRVRGALPAARPNKSADPVPGADPFGSATSSGVLVGGEASDGVELVAADYEGSEANKQGIFALDKTDLFNLLCLPPFSPEADVAKSVWSTAAGYCEKRRALLLVDAPASWKTKAAAKSGLDSDIGLAHKNAALFFPRLKRPNPQRDGQIEEFAACGAVAGVLARTDAQRGVWKAPAGLEATLIGVPELSVPLTDAENGELNPLGINCLRTFPVAGRVVWGARTLRGRRPPGSEWKYIPVRRMALFIEESLYRGTQWVVFEPNDEPLWAQIRLNVGAFMHNLFRQGAFQGKTPREAYFVKCDKETTTQNDINLGIVNIVVGFAPLKPAEFVIIKIQQMAGQIAGLINRRSTDMAQFSVNAQRFDPYKNFKFRVKWDGRYVAGVSKVSALKRTTEVVKHREGGDPSSSRKSPGPHRIRGDHAGARRDPRPRVREVGEQGLELRRRAWARRSR